MTLSSRCSGGSSGFERFQQLNGLKIQKSRAALLEVIPENSRCPSNFASYSNRCAAFKGKDRHIDLVYRDRNRRRYNRLRADSRIAAIRPERIYQSRSRAVSARQESARDGADLESALQAVQSARSDRHVELGRERHRYRARGHQGETLSRAGVAPAWRRAKSGASL